MAKGSSLGVALGGGGSRAFIHLGVLLRLEEAGIRPDFLSGSSMGAVLGALYAANPGGREAIGRILDYFRKSTLFGSLVRQTKNDGLQKRPGFIGTFIRKVATASIAGTISFRKGLRSMNPVSHAIEEHFGKAGTTFEQLRIPFAANALNLTEARLDEHRSGPLAPALKAGVTVGLVFAPYEWDGCQHADAAPLAPVPVTMCRNLGAERVLAVDICAALAKPHHCHTGFDVVQRIMALQSDALNRGEIEKADVLLRVDASDIFWGDFSRIDELVERGRIATEQILPQLG